MKLFLALFLAVSLASACGDDSDPAMPSPVAPVASETPSVVSSSAPWRHAEAVAYADRGVLFSRVPRGDRGDEYLIVSRSCDGIKSQLVDWDHLYGVHRVFRKDRIPMGDDLRVTGSYIRDGRRYCLRYR